MMPPAYFLFAKSQTTYYRSVVQINLQLNVLNSTSVCLIVGAQMIMTLFVIWVVIIGRRQNAKGEGGSSMWEVGTPPLQGLPISQFLEIKV